MVIDDTDTIVDVTFEGGSPQEESSRPQLFEGLPPGTAIPPGYYLVKVGTLQAGDLIYNITYYRWADAPQNQLGQQVRHFYGVARRN